VGGGLDKVAFRKWVELVFGDVVEDEDFKQKMEALGATFVAFEKGIPPGIERTPHTCCVQLCRGRGSAPQVRASAAVHASHWHLNGSHESTL